MSAILSPQALAGIRALLIGAAREGTALARYLVRCGALVTLSDNWPAR